MPLFLLRLYYCIRFFVYLLSQVRLSTEKKTNFLSRHGHSHIISITIMIIADDKNKDLSFFLPSQNWTKKAILGKKGKSWSAGLYCCCPADIFVTWFLLVSLNNKKTKLWYMEKILLTFQQMYHLHTLLYYDAVTFGKCQQEECVNRHTSSSSFFVDYSSLPFPPC